MPHDNVRSMRKMDEIIIHATATRPGWWSEATPLEKVEEIRRWHVEDRKWSDVGYHFLIDRDGTVVEGRPLWRTGAHVRNHNTGTIGIALFGGHGSAATDKFSDHYTSAQDFALRGLIKDLTTKYGWMKLSGHNEYSAKACPGFNVGEWWGE